MDARARSIRWTMVPKPRGSAIVLHSSSSPTARRRVVAREHRAEVVRCHLTSDPDPGGNTAKPAAGRFARVEVVVLGAVEDLLQVVRLLTEAERPDAQHDRPTWAAGRTLVPVYGFVQLVVLDTMDDDSCGGTRLWCARSGSAIVGADAQQAHDCGTRDAKASAESHRGDAGLAVGASHALASS